MTYERNRDPDSKHMPALKYVQGPPRFKSPGNLRRGSDPLVSFSTHPPTPPSTPPLQTDLEGVESPLAQVVGVEQLQLVEQLDEEVGPRLVLGDERGHLRVDGLPQGLEQGEVAARVWGAGGWGEG